VTRAYVGLGANLGPREVTLLRAVDLLAETEGVDVLQGSQLRQTEPFGVVDQPPYLNGAVVVDTTLTPRELLERLLEIERQLGRVRDVRWGARTIDLDLLVYGDLSVDEPGLRVPHPRLAERRFALEPLAELDPALDIPGLGDVSAALSALD
jgi:2-amino-4-hydroxy-6-hydroxymethyldihydropteridine diphosphokinase